MSGGIWAVAACAGGLTACSLLVSTDGLAGTAPPAPPDASPALEAGASDDAGVAGSRWCQQRSPAPFFCDDFDGPTLEPRWEPTGPAIVDDGAAASAPRSFLSTTSDAPTQTIDATALVLDAPLQRHVRFSWSMLAEDITRCSAANLGALTYPGNDGFYLVQLQLHSDGTLHIQEYGQQNGATAVAGDARVGPRPPSDRWLRVALEVDLDATGGPTASVRLDDSGTPTAFALHPLGTVGDRMFVNLGIVYVAVPSGRCSFRYDDVTFELL